MPIQILSKEYTDLFNVDRSFLRGNAGDRQLLKVWMRCSISISSLNNPLTLDISNYQIISSSQSWLDEGFRLGDTVQLDFYDQLNPVPLNSYQADITYIDDQIIEVNTLLGWYSIVNDQFAVISVVDRARDTLEVLTNFTQNNQPGSEFSLIDGEVTRIVYENVNALAPTFDITGVQTGNKSGSFQIGSLLERVDSGTSSIEREYKLYLTTTQSGVYDADWFFSNDCLKQYTKMLWSSLANEPYSQTELVINDGSDTGWFNEAFNTGSINASLIQGISYVDYQFPTTGQFVIDSSVALYGFGSCYIPLDESYYKNRPYSQSEITMNIPTTDFGIIGTPYSSNVNEFGAGYTLEITNISVVGTVYTCDFELIPNAQFATFFEGREEGDRKFYIWARFGDVNLLVFDGQMETQPPSGGLWIPEISQFFDHSEQTTAPTINIQGYSANIEDDLGWTGYFKLDNSTVYESVTAKIEAFNTSTLESFTLNSTYFDFSTVPYNGTKHLLNITQPVQTQLPTTSVKRDAFLFLQPSIDTLTQYGVVLYFPFLYRWEYWLQQTNADSDFYPNDQTKNWFPYDSTGDWTVRLKIDLVKDGLSYSHIENLTIKNYDSDPVIKQAIELYVDSTNQNVQIVVENELMRVVATHDLIDGTGWNPAEIWGMITVEPKEGAPRYILSTVVPFDYNPNNPLTPLSGTLMDITFPSINLARMECYFDPTKIDLSNGVKFTTKVKGCTGEEFLLTKLTTSGVPKETTDGNTKLIAE
jgi:hypothetical protein